MVDFLASRPMEDFFINPTVMHTRRNLSTVTMDDTLLYRAALREYHHERRSSSSKEAALKQFALPTPTFSYLNRHSYSRQGYTSEEEQASSNDNDSLSSYSNGATSVASDMYFPEALASGCTTPAEQQCNQARVVQIHTAGRAKLVSLPKLVTVPAKKSVVRLANDSTDEKRRASLPQFEMVQARHSSRRSQDSSSDESTDSLSAVSPTSTAPSSIDEQNEDVPRPQHKKSISGHVPLMQAAREISPTSPMYPPELIPMRRGSAAPGDVTLSSNSPAQPQLRRVSKFGLNRAYTMGKSLVRKDERHQLDTLKEPEPTQISPLSSRAQFPARTTSLNKSKLVPRGADEREPTITLPPYPA